MDKKWITVLDKSILFQNVGAESLQVMLDCLRPKLVDYKKNSYITNEGEPSHALGILLSGEAAIIKENAAGNRIIMTVIGAGDMFGEMVAFARKRVWPASVLAQSDCTVMFLPPERITGECQNMCASHKLLINNMLQVISERALVLTRKVEYLAIKSMRGKISTYLLEQNKFSGKDTFMLPLSRNGLADFLNVARTALSRELGRMRDEGLIEFHRDSIKIIDMAALKKVIE